MKILFICYEHPSASIAGSHRVLYSIKYLSQKYKHDITLVAFRVIGKVYPKLNEYCRTETIDITYRPGLTSVASFFSVLKSICTFKVKLHPEWTNYSYSSKMDKKIKGLLDNKYDIICVDHPVMIQYVSGKNIPIVLLEAFACAEITKMELEMEANWIKKAARLIYHYQTKNYAEYYKNTVDLSIAVSSFQREMVIEHCPSLNINVIPYGVDTDYFSLRGDETPFPSLIINGNMNGPRNVATVLGFYRNIFPLVKKRIPKIKLYIVGGNPDKKILRLAKDKSVEITGYVDDLRPYLSRAWVVVAPLKEGFGVKVRVLQAMAAAKAVVASPMVSQGIDVINEENIIIANESHEFAERVIELINDRHTRIRIGNNARLLMETSHSWEKLTGELNDILESVVQKRGK